MRGLRQGIADRVDGCAADEVLGIGERQAEAGRRGVQHGARRGGHLGADPVAGEEDDGVGHGRSEC